MNSVFTLIHKARLTGQQDEREGCRLMTAQAVPCPAGGIVTTLLVGRAFEAGLYQLKLQGRPIGHLSEE